MKKLFIAGDIHDDAESLNVFANYAVSQNPNHILIDGDFSLRPYTTKDLELLLESQRAEDTARVAGIRSFIAAKRKTNETILGEMKRILDSTQIPYFVVPGNYDPDLSGMFGERDINKRTQTLGEAKIFGYGGADAFPPHIQFLAQLGEIANSESRQKYHGELFNGLVKEKPQIILSHNPPKNLCDDLFNGQNVGTPAITQYLGENPDSTTLVICGHIHEAGPLGNNPNGVKGIRKINNTIIVNPGNLGRFELINFPQLTTMRQFDYGTFCSAEIEDNGKVKKVTQYTIKADGKYGEVKPIQIIE